MLLELSGFGQETLRRVRELDYQALRAKGPTIALLQFEAMYVIDGSIVAPKYVEHNGYASIEAELLR